MRRDQLRHLMYPSSSRQDLVVYVGSDSPAVMYIAESLADTDEDLIAADALQCWFGLIDGFEVNISFTFSSRVEAFLFPAAAEGEGL